MCWTLGPIARVQVLAGHDVVSLSKTHIASSSRIGRKTVGLFSCRVGVGDVNFPMRLLCGGCPPLGWDGWKRHMAHLHLNELFYIMRYVVK